MCACTTGHLHALCVYETPLHFYVVGSDESGTRFSTLKIDRSAERDFVAGEPDHDYSLSEIGELLATVSSSSIVTPTEKWGRKWGGRKRASAISNGGLLRTLEKAYGIIGAVCFLEGYYLLIVTKAKVAHQLGYHIIYEIEDVSMLYMPASGAPVLQEEQKYARLFQSVDLTSNFYFSYTYDLTRTLQENVLALRKSKWNGNSYFVGMPPERRFVWNKFLLEPFRRNQIDTKWTLHIVHGYVGHQFVDLPCSSLSLVLLSRRSSEFAGTRFLKRGMNFDGSVANDVETEQIVWDTSASPSFLHGRFTAFVQRRGSVPLFWSQDSAFRQGRNLANIGKPPIFIDRIEPHAMTTAMHFKNLKRKYGSPIIVINSVKREDRKYNEHLLHDIFLKCVRYLNQFSVPGDCIDYISFDISRCKKKGLNVLQKLEWLGQRTTVFSTGWFQSFPQLKSQQNSAKFGGGGVIKAANSEENDELCYSPVCSADGALVLQHGVVRTNCVDCLDRTNVVQFGIGKRALAWQMYSLGFIDDPERVTMDTELCKAFEALYDEHGDTLALQYAGSQLVHSIKTYKKSSMIRERSRDVLQTISRYYSNTFSDFEKQDGINLFLGLFRPEFLPLGKVQHWTMGLDHHLHFAPRFTPRSEWLVWAFSVASNIDDLKNDPATWEWAKSKARESGINDLEDDESDFCCSKEQKTLSTDIKNKNNETNLCGIDDEQAIYDIAHRTFELTTLEELVRREQHLRHSHPHRRPLALHAADQVPVSSGFMRMFKSSAPEPSCEYRTAGGVSGSSGSGGSLTPPASPTGFARRRSSGGLVSATAAPYSSLAAGTASIVLRPPAPSGSCTGVIEFASNDSTSPPPSSRADAISIHRKLSREDCGGCVSSTSPTPPPAALRERRCLSGVDEDLDEGVEEADEQDDDLKVDEDLNHPAVIRETDLLRKFTAMLSAKKANAVDKQKKEKTHLTLSTGLRSTAETYFGFADAVTDSQTALFSICAKDIATYKRYADAADHVMEMHAEQYQSQKHWAIALKNRQLQKQKQKVTPKKASIPLQRSLTSFSRRVAMGPALRTKTSVFSSASTSSVVSNTSSAKRSIQLMTPRKSGEAKAQQQTMSLKRVPPPPLVLSSSSSSTPNKDSVDSNESPNPSSSADDSKNSNYCFGIVDTSSSPLRKTFCKLGPMFEFRPAFFTIDSAFHTELSPVSEKSMEMYRQAAAQFALSRYGTSIQELDKNDCFDDTENELDDI